MALEAAGANGSSGIPMKEIDAGEILEKVQKGQPVEYDHVIVRGDLDLSRDRLQKNITSYIRISDSIFKGLVSFNGSTLEVDLSASNFTRDVHFVGATFDYARLGGATFSGDASFVGADFGSGADFRGADFSCYAEFDYATFRSGADFTETAFRSDADFEGADFRSDAGFFNAAFRSDADFKGANFSNGTTFMRADFRSEADFEGADFSDYADFWGANFGGYADFRRADFSCYAEFDYATFRSDANFEEAVFSGDAGFFNAAFSGYALFSKVTFSGYARFREVTFSGYAGFSKVTFSNDTSFAEAEFNENIEFEDARFENETSFYRILFKRPAYFENSSIKSLNLTKADFGRLHLRWKNITGLHFDEAAYLALIKNYNTLGWYGDANRCYYDYRNAVRRNWSTASSTGFEASILKLFDLFIDYMEWILYGYGVRPIIPISWSAIIILVFGLFFRQKRCLRKIITEERIEDAGDGSDEVLVESKARKAPTNFLDPFLFSIFTFTSGFTAFLHPVVEYKMERCLRWAIAERLLGPFFLALVITAISKTYLIR